VAPGSFPSGITAYTNPTAANTTAEEVGTRDHAEFHADNNDDLEQVMTKLGTGASTPSANTVLRGTGAGSSAFGQVAAADIAANAASQVAVATNITTNPTTTSGTLADIPDMTVTLTTTGGPVVVLFWGQFQRTVLDGGVFLALLVDGIDQGLYPQMLANVVSSAESLVFCWPMTPSAASHTIKVQWARTGTGTATVGYRSLTVIEHKR
jgi:hypothetical protein